MKKRLTLIVALLLIASMSFAACDADVTINTNNTGTTAPADTTKPAEDFGEEDTGDYSQPDNTLADSEGILANSALEKVGENEYKLTADITVEDVCTTEFSGTIDGNGKTVTTSVPLFLDIKGATFKNLTIAGTIEYSQEERAVGGLAINANGATLENCTNKTAITGYSAAGATLLFTAGGFIGVSTGAIVATNCTNEGAINCAAEAAGLIGFAESGSLTITNCTNKGAITSRYGGAGGLIGRSGEKSNAGAKAEITGCTNSGVIKGHTHAGGIFGALEGAKPNKTITDCINTADITGAKNVGGIGGKIKSGDTKNNRSNVTIVQRCGNTGNITAYSEEKYVNIYDTACFAAGIVGYIESGPGGCVVKVTLCYTTGDISANRNYTDDNTPTGNANYAAGLFNGYQMRVMQAADPNNLAMYGNNYDTSYVSGNIISGKIEAAENADGTKTALLFTDLAIGSWTWSEYNLNNFFGKNFYDITVTGELALVSPSAEHPEKLGYGAIGPVNKIGEGKINDAEFISIVNDAIKNDSKLGITSDVYAVGAAGIPVFVGK